MVDSIILYRAWLQPRQERAGDSISSERKPEEARAGLPSLRKSKLICGTRPGYSLSSPLGYAILGFALLECIAFERPG